jgi:hypothetical protein
MRISLIPLLLMSTFTLAPALMTAEQLHPPMHLRCESLETPLGLDTPAPRFSWQLEDSRQGAKQTAYEIQVTSHPELIASGRADVEMELHAKSVTEPKPGVYVLDFGQNMAAIPALRVQGHAGTTRRLRFAEVLNPDGTIYTENLRTALASDQYTLSGKGVEEYQPDLRFMDSGMWRLPGCHQRARRIS